MAARGFDSSRAAAAVRELLIAIGEDPDRSELQSTPERVAASYAELCSGVGVDPSSVLGDPLPDTSGGEAVLVKDIELLSLCEHHLLPFKGVAHIAYLPSSQIVGFGALPRLVSVLASRPQVQERLGEQIMTTLDSALATRGVLVVIEAVHGCMRDRGSRQTSATAVTVAACGELREPLRRAELMALIGEKREGAAH